MTATNSAGSASAQSAQTAIVATLTTQRFHDNIAYERFTPNGPLAVLPLADGRPAHAEVPRHRSRGGSAGSR